MKSINKLREIASRLDDAAASVSEHGFSPIAIKASLLCDEIEAEIERDYMKLPADADGLTDSRERIEADMHRWLTSHVAVSVFTNDVEAEVRKWLDRQAAITANEYANRHGILLDEANLERAKCSILQTQVRKLTAERDALAADLEECMDERERYRACFGNAVDKAHEIQRIMDRFCTSGKGAGACQSPANGRCARNRVAEGGKPDGGGSSGVYAMPRQQITTDYMQTV